LVPDDNFINTTDNESKWGIVSGDGSFTVFHAGGMNYPDASLTAWETYLWRKSDKSIHKTQCASFSVLDELEGGAGSIDGKTTQQLFRMMDVSSLLWQVLSQLH